MPAVIVALADAVITGQAPVAFLLARILFDRRSVTGSAILHQRGRDALSLSQRLAVAFARGATHERNRPLALAGGCRAIQAVFGLVLLKQVKVALHRAALSARRQRDGRLAQPMTG